MYLFLQKLVSISAVVVGALAFLEFSFACSIPFESFNICLKSEARCNLAKIGFGAKKILTMNQGKLFVRSKENPGQLSTVEGPVQ